MKIFKTIFKILGFTISIPILYLLIGLLLSLIPVNTKQQENTTKTIYLSTNGVHLDVVIPKSYLSPSLLQDLKYKENEPYFAFGWGDENFYINTPSWADLRLKNAASALLWNSPSLIHLTRYQNLQKDWVAVPINDAQLDLLNVELNNRFALDEADSKILLDEPGYYHNDHFYGAKGSYHAFRTCNSWINDLFKTAKIKTSLWTPYDFGVMWWH